MLANDKKPDLILITETWCNKDISSNLLNIDNYYIDASLRIDRNDTLNGIGGGLLVYIKNGMMILPNDNNSNFNQYCSFKICDNKSQSKMNVTLIYRSPNSTTANNDLLFDLIDVIADTENNIILGDFNLPNIDWKTLNCDRKSQRLIDISTTKSLVQIVDFPTHIKGNILDLVFTDRPENILNIENLGNLANSDHSIISIDILTDFFPQSDNIFTLDWSHANNDAISNHLLSCNFQTQFSDKSVVECWDILTDEINTAIEANVPKRKAKDPKKPVWMTRRIIQLSRQKRRKFALYCSDRTRANHEDYKKIEKQCRKAVRTSKRKFEKKLADNKNMKPFNSYTKGKLKTKSNIGPIIHNGSLLQDNKEMAKVFNDYFSSVFSRTINNSDAPIDNRSNIPTLDRLIITENMLREKIDNLKPKFSCGPDNINNRFIKDFSKELIPALTNIFNKSLEESSLPADWKNANITPIFKKGSKGSVSNYRPISLTSAICKILESLIKEMIVEHLTRHQLLNKSQHGFMNGRSCSTNLLEFLETIILNMDNGVATDIVYLDFDKAFDKVPIKKLLMKVKSLNVDGKILAWISAWLDNRKQRVVISGKYSDWTEVVSGVPQGSVLGPLLFLIFINDIDDTVKLIDLIKKFADDTKAAQGIRSDADRLKLQTALDQLCAWADKWDMEFNLDKCKVIHIGRNNPQHSYTMKGQALSKADSEKDIGVWITDNLKPSTQCREAYRVASAMLNNISRAFHFRDRHIFLRLYKTYVRVHLEFSTPVWTPWLKVDIDLLEKVQIRAVNMISGLHGTTYESKLKELKIQTLQDRRTRFDVIQVFKILKGYDKVNPNTWFEFETRRSTRNSHQMNLKIKRRNTDLARNFFTVRAASHWNKLPSHIKEATTLSNFKSKYDTFAMNGQN